MANWDEDSGYYCLLIAILCNLDVYESILMYKYGPDYPLCQKILKKKVRKCQTACIMLFIAILLPYGDG